jgi:hypothetical protein
MTDQSVVTVGAFLFRFCGLIARAFTQTLLLAPAFWESGTFTDEAGDTHPDVASRVARFDSIAVMRPDEFKALKNFRTASARIIGTVRAAISSMLQGMPRDSVDKLRTLSNSISE